MWLYKSLCWSVGPLVGQSVALFKFLLKSFLNYIFAPAHPHATDAVVYTALFYCNCYIKLPNNSGPVNVSFIFHSSYQVVIESFTTKEIDEKWLVQLSSPLCCKLLFVFPLFFWTAYPTGTFYPYLDLDLWNISQGGKVIFWCCPELRYKIHRTHLKMLLL